jgi:protein-disulfide isomerase
MASSSREQLRAQQAARAKQAKTMRIFGFAAIALSVLILGVFGTVVFQALTKSNQVAPPNATADKTGIQPYPGKANAGAPVVELFFDYQCPGCASLEKLYGAKLTELATTGEIDLRYRNMYFLDDNLGNDSSLRAATAAACADVVGHYPDYHSTIFANQPSKEGAGYSTELLRTTIAAKVGITGDALTTFQSCYDKSLTADFVKAADSANRPLIQTTPTLHVNGKVFEISVNPDQLLDAIKKAAA